MPKKKKPKPDNPEQFARFAEVAEKIKTDDAGKRSEEAFGKIAKSKPARQKKTERINNDPLYKEHVLDFGDLKLLGVVCRKCGAEVILDMSNPDRFYLKPCACCAQDVEEFFKTAAGNFHAAYIGVTKDSKAFSAQIRIRTEAKAIE